MHQAAAAVVHIDSFIVQLGVIPASGLYLQLQNIERLLFVKQKHGHCDSCEHTWSA